MGKTVTLKDRVLDSMQVPILDCFKMIPLSTSPEQEKSVILNQRAT